MVGALRLWGTGSEHSGQLGKGREGGPLLWVRPLWATSPKGQGICEIS